MGEPLIQKEVPEDAPITETSVTLFRLGEACNNRCPMCTNSGLPEAFFFDEAELLRRVGFVHARGLRRVVITGGEPTIHPGFWSVVARLGELGMSWDINTHGRRFAEPEFTARAMREGLQRAIVSLHGHEEQVSRIMSGISAKGHDETIRGIEQLLGQGAAVIINLVVSEWTAATLPEFVAWCAERFGAPAHGGPRYAIKFAFPSLLSKGESWAPIRIRLSDTAASLERLPEVADEAGIELMFESFPNCVLGESGAKNVGRLGFGETHYLDDVTGDALYSIAWLEARDAVYARACQLCEAFEACPGVSARYVELFGTDELKPFLSGPIPWWFGA
ncbi:MAG: hypothetical protein CMH57_01150 [Myxococcales bacterium]|nr:hypothetical protein [Myxococcales bacterium]